MRSSVPRTGMSKNERLPRLLKTIGGSTTTTAKPATEVGKKKNPPKREVLIPAPPFSSDEEGNSGGELKPESVTEAKKNGLEREEPKATEAEKKSSRTPEKGSDVSEPPASSGEENPGEEVKLKSVTETKKKGRKGEESKATEAQKKSSRASKRGHDASAHPASSDEEDSDGESSPDPVTETKKKGPKSRQLKAAEVGKKSSAPRREVDVLAPPISSDEEDWGGEFKSDTVAEPKKKGLKRKVSPKAAVTRKKNPSPKSDVDVFAPPISSGEDDSGGEAKPEVVAEPKRKDSKRKQPEATPQSDGEEEGSSDRADIMPTLFKKSFEAGLFPKAMYSGSSRLSKSQYPKSQKTYGGSARSSQESKPSSSNQTSSQRSRNAKGPGDIGPSSGDSLLRDPEKKYVGERKRPETSSPPRGSRNKRVKKEAEEPVREPTPPPKLKLPEEILASLKGEPGHRSSLKIPAGAAGDSSPQMPTRTLRRVSLSPPVPVAVASLDTRLLGSSDDDSSTESRRRKPSLKTALDGAAKTTRKRTADGNKKPPTTRAPIDTSFEVADSLSELSSDDFADQKESEARCPNCDRVISHDLLQKYSRDGYMAIHTQHRLCAEHKRDEARAEWKAKSYPDIDWSRVGARILSHHDYLEGILMGNRCHYGDNLARDIKAGGKRNLTRADFDNSPGYYGPKGFRAMQEGIFEMFSVLMRKKAVENELLSARGYSLYVQAVLVPELAVKLVMEDMKVGPEEARDVLQESTWVGDLLCEDLGDTVNEDDEDVF
ncbi:uncharacterized protein DNG_00227 [Cephalotrichum gorgonifer]|uniref:Restriction of telomere capping protein 4 n=1 Tax=Cephalotrichum gorgonifer TaxID=2041049 RepID=A0AAE8SQZ8_9PEZI|nr:uncharacterized protein DNG_00227 [Cephalotrichum gorgonifer]